MITITSDSGLIRFASAKSSKPLMSGRFLSVNRISTPCASIRFLACWPVEQQLSLQGPSAKTASRIWRMTGSSSTMSKWRCRSAAFKSAPPQDRPQTCARDRMPPDSVETLGIRCAWIFRRPHRSDPNSARAMPICLACQFRMKLSRIHRLVCNPDCLKDNGLLSCSILGQTRRDLCGFLSHKVL